MRANNLCTARPSRLNFARLMTGFELVTYRQNVEHTEYVNMIDATHIDGARHNVHPNPFLPVTSSATVIRSARNFPWYTREQTSWKGASFVALLN